MLESESEKNEILPDNLSYRDINKEYEKFTLKYPFRNMKTDEEGVEKLARRLRCDSKTALNEILGNINGDIIQIFIDENYTNMKIFVNDRWTEDDKNALHTKCKTGSNRYTASINGLGVIMVIDRFLNEEEHVKYSIIDEKDDKYISHIGKFQCSDWTKINKENIDEFENHYSGDLQNIEGTSISIPLSKYSSKFKKLDTECNNYGIRFYISKFFNRLLTKKTINYNGERLDFRPLCENSIEIECSLCWDIHSDYKGDNSNGYYPDILKITNHDSVEKKFPKLPKLIELPSTQNKNNNYISEGYTKKADGFTLTEKDEFKIRISLLDNKQVSSQKKAYKYENDTKTVRGLHVYLSEKCLTTEPIYKGLGGKAGDGGALGTKYGGHERFEVEIGSKTLLYNLPVDKTSIKPSTRGLKINRFIRHICEAYPEYIPNQEEETETKEDEETTEDEKTTDDDAGVEEGDIVNEVEVTEDDTGVEEGDIVNEVEVTEDDTEVVEENDEEAAADETKQKPRKDFDTATKALARYTQNNRCAITGIPLGPSCEDYNHKDGDRENNNPNNCEVLTTEVHAIVSRDVNNRQNIRGNPIKFVKDHIIRYFDSELLDENSRIELIKQICETYNINIGDLE